MAADVRALLVEVGYSVHFREHGWTECLPVRGEERWLGQGEGEHQALEDAIRHAAPSHLARMLLVRALTTEAVEPEPPSPPPAIENGAANASPNDVETAPPLESTEEVDDADAAFELRELQAKIDADADDLSMSNAHRQRLVLLAWIARARSYQERSDADEVHYGVRAVASQLGAFARAWWLGSVPALQLAARPSDASKNLHMSRDPGSWEEVATLAEQRLVDLEAAELAYAHGTTAAPFVKLPRARWMRRNVSCRRSSASDGLAHRRSRNIRSRGASF